MRPDHLTEATSDQESLQWQFPERLPNLDPPTIVVRLEVEIDGPSDRNRWLLTVVEVDTAEQVACLLALLPRDVFPSEWWRELVEAVITAQSRVSPF